MKIETVKVRPWLYFINFEKIDRSQDWQQLHLAASCTWCNRHWIEIIKFCYELVGEALLRYNIEVINNDERIEKNSFLNNDVSDDKNTENGSVSSVTQSGIIDFEITKLFLLQKLWRN